MSGFWICWLLPCLLIELTWIDCINCLTLRMWFRCCIKEPCHVLLTAWCLDIACVPLFVKFHVIPISPLGVKVFHVVIYRGIAALAQARELHLEATVSFASPANTGVQQKTNDRTVVQISKKTCSISWPIIAACLVSYSIIALNMIPRYVGSMLDSIGQGEINTENLARATAVRNLCFHNTDLWIYAYMYSGVKAETVFRTQLLGELLVDLQAGKKP